MISLCVCIAQKCFWNQADMGSDVSNGLPGKKCQYWQKSSDSVNRFIFCSFCINENIIKQDAQLSTVPRTSMVPCYISLGYLIYYRMITFYLLPMLAECGRGNISLQSPVTYQVEIDQCKKNFESVTSD